ncbi:MAG: hypothetical protein R6V51_02810 [Dehalococcoidia bacterium]
MTQRIQATTLPPTVGQQIFAIGSAVAGGVAGIIVARKFADLQEVPTNYVLAATLISSVFTVGAALYLVNKSTEL